MDPISDSTTSTTPADATATNHVPLTTETREMYARPQIQTAIAKRGGFKAFFRAMILANIPRDGKATFINKRVEPPVTEEVPAVTLESFMEFWYTWFVATDPFQRKGLRYDGANELECGLNIAHQGKRNFLNLRWVITTKQGEIVFDRNSAVEAKDRKPLYEGSYFPVDGKAIAACPACKKALRESNQRRYDAAKAAAIASNKRPPAFEHVRFLVKTEADKVLSASKLAEARKVAVSEAAAKVLGSATKLQDRKPTFGRKDRGRR